MTHTRLIAALALVIVILALLSEQTPPREERSNILPFKKAA